jgi:carbamate kinase
MSEGKRIGRTTSAELRRYSFDPGSMGPKVEAACRFADRTGRAAGIGAVEDAEAILAGCAGTIVNAVDTPNSTQIDFPQ